MKLKMNFPGGRGGGNGYFLELHNKLSIKFCLATLFITLQAFSECVMFPPLKLWHTTVNVESGQTHKDTCYNVAQHPTFVKGSQVMKQTRITVIL